MDPIPAVGLVHIVSCHHYVDITTAVLKAHGDHGLVNSLGEIPNTHAARKRLGQEERLDRYRVPCSPDSPCLACPDQVEDEAFREAEYLVKLVPTVVPYSNPSDTLGDSLDVLIPLDGTPPPATISPDYQHLACNLDYFFLLPKRDSDSWHMPLRLCPQSTIAVLLEAQKLPQYDPTLYASYRSPIVYATLGSAVAHTEKEEKKAQALPSEDDLHLSLGPSQEATQEGSYGEVDPVATQDPGIQLSFAQATQDDNQGNGFRPPTMKGKHKESPAVPAKTTALPKHPSLKRKAERS